MTPATRTTAPPRVLIARAGLAASLFLACGDEAEGDDASETGDAAPEVVAECDPGLAGFSVAIDNPWLPFVVGDVHVLEGLEGGTEPSRFSTTVLEDTEIVAGVTTRVVEVRSFEGDTMDELDELVEVTRAFYAQAADGTVCYFGEDKDTIEDGEIVGHEDSWRAGVDGAWPAIAMPAEPAVGMTFTMVYIPGEVETAEITHLGEATTTPAGTFDETMTVLEDGPSIKKYAAGIGQIYDDGMELVSY